MKLQLQTVFKIQLIENRAFAFHFCTMESNLLCVLVIFGSIRLNECNNYALD